MKINYDEFMLRILRPALFKGEELELSVEFKNATMYNVDVGTSKAIKTTVGVFLPNSIRAFSPPIKAVSSSLTILIIC